MIAPINKILPYSVVDGSGCRGAVFFQQCNIACRYCHNPETQRLCRGCGRCASLCSAGALTLLDGAMVWNQQRCTDCGMCIATCPHRASPKVMWMTPEQVFAKVCESLPFICGITTSGGECSLYPEFLERLYTLAQKKKLSCLMDSNGTIDLSQYPSLMDVCDGVLLDVKAWGPEVFRSLTGGDAAALRKNLAWLAAKGKLAEVRVVVLPGHMDAEACIEGIAATIGSAQTRRAVLKLIRFRCFGVRGPMENTPSPSMELMEMLQNRALDCGFENVRIV